MHESIEMQLAQAIIGRTKASILMTDGYKFSMAQAGFPLREETFVLCFRKGGPFFNPFDLVELIKHFIPEQPSVKEAAFLTANGYGMTPAMEKALTMPVKVVAAPKNTWIAAGTPVLTVTGPSFLVSWLEPFLIMLHYPIQIATVARRGERNFTVVCQDEDSILGLVEKAYNPPRLHMGFDYDATKGKNVAYDYEASKFRITFDDDYKDRVRANILAVKAALGGETERAFEVGLRASTCMQQHMMVLEVCREVGVIKTSNVYGAWKFYMVPVGTTGHEHQMRWGGPTADDHLGFRAIRDMRPEPPSYLFDTTDPMFMGIPAALEVMAEDPTRACSMRFDSGDQDAQFEKIMVGCRKYVPEEKETLTSFIDVLNPNLIFEDGYTADKTVKNEAFCDAEGWPRHKRMYGYGGFLVSKPHPSPYNRDVVSAAYKLSCTAGRTVMKFSGSPGKESIPGKPIVWQYVNSENIVIQMIAQEGEENHLVGWTSHKPIDFIPEHIVVLKSSATQDLIRQINDAIKGA